MGPPHLLICSLYASFGKAMDYSADDDSKCKVIQAKLYETPDENQQDAITAKRLAMRKFLWTRTHREIGLRPM